MKTSPSSLTDVQRRALALAQAERWTIWAESRDGTRVRLRPGHPGRHLVLLLAGALPADDLALERAA